jgi:hypothetical protein
MSDDVENDAMDVDMSSEQTAALHGNKADTESEVTFADTNSDSDLIPDHIVLESDPSDYPPGGFERDPNTGRFTAASFMNFSDNLLG